MPGYTVPDEICLDDIFAQAIPDLRYERGKASTKNLGVGRRAYVTTSTHGMAVTLVQGDDQISYLLDLNSVIAAVVRAHDGVDS